MNLPETPVAPGREQDAIREHARKMASRAALDRLQGVVGKIEEDERAKRKLMRYAVTGLVIVAAATAVVFVLAVLSP